MWISTSTVDLVALRALPSEQGAELLALLQAKRYELAGTDNDGASTPEFPAVQSIPSVDPNLNTLVIKRNWSTQAKAQEFADFGNATADFITVTVEESV